MRLMPPFLLFFAAAKDRFGFKVQRTQTVLVNTFWSLFFKGVSILTSFLLVPLCLKAMSQKEYGIALTVTAIVNWISFFDVGIGNGLRTKLGQALAEGDLMTGKKYVSTAYYYISLICLGLLLLYGGLHSFIDWHSFLNVKPEEAPNLPSCIFLVIAIFALRFILQLISMVLLADQRSYLNDSILPIANVMTLGVVFFLYRYGKTNLQSVMLTTVAMPAGVLLLYTFWLFNGRYKPLRPSRKSVSTALRKGLLTLGWQFFLLQMCVLIVFSTSEVLIAKLYSVEQVTTFNIASKYYGFSFLLANMVIGPLWGAFTNAWYQKDVAWIVSVIRRMHALNFLLLIANGVLFMAATPLLKLWLGKEAPISTGLALSLIFYNTQLIFNNVFALFLNAVGKLKVQVITSVIGAAINIPITIVLVENTNLGLASIGLANLISLVPSSIFTSVQANRLLKTSVPGKTNALKEPIEEAYA